MSDHLDFTTATTKHGKVDVARFDDTITFRFNGDPAPVSHLHGRTVSCRNVYMMRKAAVAWIAMHPAENLGVRRYRLIDAHGNEA